MNVNVVDTDENLEPVTYICSDCGKDVVLQPVSAVRCRNCGSRILYKNRSHKELQRIEGLIEDIKNSFETILNTKRDYIFQHTQLYIDSASQLELILPKITRYKILLKKPEDERPFGPNTTKRVMTLIERFEILYSVYQDELEPIFPDKVDKHMKNDQRADFKSSSDEETEEELKKMIDKCQLQTKMEIESAKAIEKPNIKIGQNLDNIVVNEIETAIFNEIKQADLSNKIVLLNTAIEILKNNNGINAKNHIIELFNQIYLNPEVLQLRVLRIQNELLQERILSYKGGTTCLLSIGFILKYGHQITHILENLMDPKNITNEPYLYLEEPSIDNFDIWDKWRNHIKFAIDTLKLTQF